VKHAACVMLLLLAAACGGNKGGSIAAKDYDRSCVRSSDCVAVHEGSFTSCQQTPACANASINKSEDYRYAMAVEAMTAPCPPPDLSTCLGWELTCPAGTCVFEDPTTDGGSQNRIISADDYPQDCETVDDCMAVYSGTLGCCGGACPNSVIRADALAAYTKSLEAHTPECLLRPPCLPPTPCTGRIACENNRCMLLGAMQ
jgi:hypothetical protein